MVTAEKANVKPVANAGPNQTVTQGDLILLDGSLSTDLDNDPLTYNWTVKSLPAGSNATLSNTAAIMPTFTVDLIGVYVFELVVHDSLDDSASSSVTITAEAGNAKPVADAGLDQAAFVNDTVTLDGSGSTDADADGLTYSWAISLLPNSTVVLSDPTVVQPTFIPDVVGQYVIELTVNDSFIDSETDTVIVTTGPGNTKPVANAGADQMIVEGNPAMLDGSGSSDANEDPLQYTWAIMASPAGSNAVLSDTKAAMPALTTDTVGVYVIALVVNDGKDDSEADMVMIIVGAANSPPVAKAGLNQAVIEGDIVKLDGSGSMDADEDDVLTYSWSFTSSPENDPEPALNNPASATPTFPANAKGTYVVQLIVNDTTVDSTPATVTITVGAGNTAPVANAGPDQAVFLDDTVTLDGSGSTDADLDPLAHSWTITSIPVGSVMPVLSDLSAVKPTFEATATGNYIAQLTVDDGKVKSLVDTVVISVDAVNVKPVANARPDQAITLGMSVTLDGNGSSDADVDPLTFAWTITAAPQGGDIPLLSDPTSATPNFVPETAGAYIAQLIVNDTMVDSDPDTVIINVENGNTRPLANAGIDQTVMVNDAVIIDGSGSSDADNDVLTYLWAITTQPTTSNISANLVDLTTTHLVFQADVAGEYVFQLMVNDGMIDSLPNTVMMTVNPENVVVPPIEEPIAEASVVQEEPELLANQENALADPDADTMKVLLAAILEVFMVMMTFVMQLVALMYELMEV